MNDILLQIKNVSRLYQDEINPLNSVQALSNINLDVYSGEFLSIIGTSGCGKTTLLRLTAGKSQARTSSAAAFFNREIYSHEAGLKARHVYAQQKHKIPEFISMIGLNGFEKSYPHQISGGMSQRVAIARSLINDTDSYGECRISARIHNINYSPAGTLTGAGSAPASRSCLTNAKSLDSTAKVKAHFPSWDFMSRLAP